MHLTFDSLLNVGRAGVTELGEVPMDECQRFYEKVKHIEGQLIYTYRVAVQLVKGSDDPKEISDIWRDMREHCGWVIQELARLQNEHPGCGDSGSLYDLALDYQSASDRRYMEAKEELQCQNPIPGLFQSLS